MITLHTYITNKQYIGYKLLKISHEAEFQEKPKRGFFYNEKQKKDFKANYNKGKYLIERLKDDKTIH